MPTDPTPDPALLELVAKALHDSECGCGDYDPAAGDEAMPYSANADAALVALAAAGRLLPPDTETRTDPYSPPPTCDCSCHRCCVPLDAWCEDCEEDHGLPVPNPITETKES